jgi:DNA-directed RNA polymerase subunit L
MNTKYDEHKRKYFVMKTNYAVVNCLRRIIQQNIPYYAFDANLMVIKKNTSLMNNDQLRLRISNFPVEGVDNSFKVFKEILEKKYEQIINNTIDEEEKINKMDDEDLIYNNEKVEIEYEKFNLTMFCKIVNDNSKTEYLNVTTDDCEFFINNNKIPSPYKKPLLISKLRAKEGFEFSAISKISNSIESPLWSCVASCYYKEIEDNLYHFYVEPRSSQINEEDILKRAKEILIEKLENIKKIVKKNKGKEIMNNGKLTITNDQFTMPNLLTYYLQEHKNIEYCGYRCEHLLNNVSSIYFKTSGMDIEKILEDICSEIKNIITNIIKV